MSSLDTAAPFAYPSSTLFHAQLSLLDLLVTPQQKLVKSTCSFLRKRLSPTLRASDSTFVKRVYRLTYTLLLILLLCTMPVSGTFAAALPLHFPPPPVSHPRAALKNSKKSYGIIQNPSLYTSKETLTRRTIGWRIFHAPFSNPRIYHQSHFSFPPTDPCLSCLSSCPDHFMVRTAIRKEASTTASPNPSIFPATKKGTLPTTSDKVSSPYQNHPQTQEHSAY